MLTSKFPKSCRLRERKDFVSLSQRATGFKGNMIFISWQRTKLPVTRIGITVTRKYGNAVQRNRFKRLVRESFRLCRHLLPIGIDCNVRPKNSVKSNGSQVAPTFTEIYQDFSLFVSKFCS